MGRRPHPRRASEPVARVRIRAGAKQSRDAIQIVRPRVCDERGLAGVFCAHTQPFCFPHRTVKFIDSDARRPHTAQF
jgi:hypothetical protein